ncbi:MAG TPA: DUF2442 domain-containing protein [Candidatus Wallbacteria bacterium]|nr:MAG: hypothetical protein BWY32_00658 [bacterium ADurb.Bin243]HPG58832.1 DUF2442 domain-containing protein [Candidatus Wallbacteria bacterium]
MDKRHEIKDIHFNGEKMSITIDGVERNYNIIDVSERLFKADESQRLNFVISPSGYGIHWPLIDEDISIDALLGIVHTPKFNKAA